MTRFAPGAAVARRRESAIHSRRWQLPCLACACTVLAACASGFPAGQAKGAIAAPSPNHDSRRPNYVILHHTTNRSVDRALATLTSPQREVSSHYLIGRDGRLYQLVDEERRAWHAGESYWRGNTDLNSASIGIELDNTGSEPFPEAQILRLLDLLRDLQERYRIPANNVLGHSDVAPRRKVDPSRHFPWQRLASEGFGLWCRQATPPPPGDGFDPLLALQDVGYDVSDPAAALAAFRRHFLASDGDGEASAEEQGLLQCLLVATRQPAAPPPSPAEPQPARPLPDTDASARPAVPIDSDY